MTHKYYIATIMFLVVSCLSLVYGIMELRADYLRERIATVREQSEFYSHVLS